MSGIIDNRLADSAADNHGAAGAVGLDSNPAVVGEKLLTIRACWCVLAQTRKSFSETNQNGRKRCDQ
jgi:hypothetical protein